MKNVEEILACRYAQAYNRVLGDALSLELAERLPLIADVIETQRSLLIYAGLKDTTKESKQKISELFTVAGAQEKLFDPLIDLVAEHRRLTLLPRILRMMYAYYLEVQGIMHFTIESAVTLTDEERDEFVQFLKKKTDKEIRYTLTINPALIAGIKMYSDTLGYEYSVQQRLSLISPT